MGTAYYLSPEQAMGKGATPRSDLYSLGVVLYEMLTGLRPFEASEVESPLSVAMMHVMENPEPPVRIAPEVPPALNELTLKLLSKDPEERYGSSEELTRELEPLANGSKSTTAVTALAGEEPASRIQPAPDQTRRDLREESAQGSGSRNSPRRWYAAVILAVLALALIGAAAYALSGDQWPGAFGAREQGGASSIEMPSLVGENLGDARGSASGDYRLSVEERVENAEPAGMILETDPEAGEEIQRGAIVGIVVSDGPSGPAAGGETGEEPERAPAAAESEVENAVRDYYEAVDRENWSYTYAHLDASSRGLFTRPE
jgi:serine/threonine-protein kinase